MKHKAFVLLTLFISLGLPLFAQTDFVITPPSAQISITSELGFGATGSFSLTCPPSGALPYTVLTNPPSLLQNQKAYYNFDNYYPDLLTQTGGTVVGTSFAADRFSRPLSSLYFDGVDDYYSTRDFTLQDNFSFSFWANPLRNMVMFAETYSSFARYTDYLLFPSWVGSGTVGGLGVALGLNGIMVIEHGPSYMPVLLSHTADLSGWKHYTIVFNDHSPKLYIDGSYVRTGLTSLKPTTIMSNLLGGFPYGNFNGSIDDFSVFDTALTPEQILTASQFNDRSRYAIQSATGTVPPSGTVQVNVQLIDTALPLGTCNDVLTLYQVSLSPVSEQIGVTLHVIPVTPGIPQDLVISNNISGDILIQWPPALSALGNPISPTYRIYRGKETDSTFSLLGSTANTNFTHLHDHINPPGKMSFYRVTAVLP